MVKLSALPGQEVGTISCPVCRKDFAPTRPDQVYCSARCRLAHYVSARGDGALRAPIRTVKVLSDGSVSVTVRFAPVDARNAFALKPGATVEVIAV